MKIITSRSIDGQSDLPRGRLRTSCDHSYQVMIVLRLLFVCFHLLCSAISCDYVQSRRPSANPNLSFARFRRDFVWQCGRKFPGRTPYTCLPDRITADEVKQALEASKYDPIKAIDVIALNYGQKLMDRHQSFIFSRPEMCSCTLL